MGSLLNEVRAVIRSVFDDDSLEITPETTAADVDGWDSIMQINIIIAIEKRLGVRFATAEIADLNSDDKNVGSLLELLAAKVEE